MIRGWIDSIRRNHALEHATVAVLLARHGPQRIAGRASADGFYIFGDVDTAELTECAEEALDRLQHGQSSLAVSPLCGTNITVAGILAATAATAVLSLDRRRFSNAFTASMLAVIAAQPIGRLVQEHITTSADLDGVEVTGTRRVVGQLQKVLTQSVR